MTSNAPQSASASDDPRAPRSILRRADLWTGIVCFGLGAGLVWIGGDYPLGTGGRIGPGYAPRLLGLLLIGIGLLLGFRAPWTADLVDTTFRPRPALLVLASVLAFAAIFGGVQIGPLTLPGAGLVPAILVSVFIANWATPDNSWRSAIALALLLAAFSWALFVKGLRLPIPVFWF